MTRFLVVLQEQYEAKQCTDRYLEKAFTREELPNKGETLVICGTGYEVDEVEHELDLDPADDGAVKVYAIIWEPDFKFILEEGSWKLREGHAS